MTIIILCALFNSFIPSIQLHNGEFESIVRHGGFAESFLLSTLACPFLNPSTTESNRLYNFQASPRPASPLTSGAESGPESKSPGSGPGAAGSASAVNRPSSPTPPGGPRAALRRRAAADHKESLRNARPSSTRAAGAGGSSGTMLKLYTDESPGLRVDPVVVLVLSLGFIFSVVGLHGEFFSGGYRK